jgi:AraC-like DNA-binding protein
VKLGVFSNERAGISSAVWLLPRRDYEMVNLITSFMYLHLPIEMMVVAGLISVVLLIFFIMNKREKLYLFTFMAVLLYMLFLVSLFFPFKNIDHSLSRFIQFASYHLFAIALLMIIQAFYSAYVPLYNRICVPFFLVLTGIVFVFRESPALIYIGNALALVTEAALIAVIAVMIPRFHRSRKDTFKLIMVSAVSIAGIGIALLEIAFSLAGGAYSLLVTAYSSPLFFLTFVIIFSRELMKKNMELDFLYARLKSQAAEGEGLSINEASRVKLDRVIAFIRENYTSDISREGLAAAVDMNPNYMSGLFKSYTGIRISDYIHQLRVDDAMARLADPEVKIIDVALTVGFESLSTFNRAFKKFAGVTPSEYRESLNT